MPANNIEPVDPLGRGSLSSLIGRGPKEVASSDQEYVGVELNRMISLVHSSMFSEQEVKLRWIKERLIRYACVCSAVIRDNYAQIFAYYSFWQFFEQTCAQKVMLIELIKHECQCYLVYCCLVLICFLWG